MTIQYGGNNQTAPEKTEDQIQEELDLQEEKEKEEAETKVEVLGEIDKILNKEESDSEEEIPEEDKEKEDDPTDETPSEESEAEEKPKEEPEDTKQDAVDDELLAIALHEGFSVEKAEEYGAERLTSILEKKIALRQKEEPSEEKKETEKFTLGLSEEQMESIDEDVAQGLKSVEQKVQSILDVNSDLKTKLDEMEGSMSKGTQQQVIAQFDSIVNEFSEKELFGAEAPKQGTAEWKNRDTLFREVDILAGVYQSKGEQTPSLKELVKKAKASAFSDFVAKEARTELTKKIEKRSKQHLMKPSDNATETPEEKEKGVLGKIKGILGVAAKR